jgi:hypothetical protein
MAEIKRFPLSLNVDGFHSLNLNTRNDTFYCLTKECRLEAKNYGSPNDLACLIAPILPDDKYLVVKGSIYHHRNFNVIRMSIDNGNFTVPFQN